MNICSWCGVEYRNTGTGFTSTEVEWRFTSCSDIFGCDLLWNWKIEDLCRNCGRKLGDKLKELGIKLVEVD